MKHNKFSIEDDLVKIAIDFKDYTESWSLNEDDSDIIPNEPQVLTQT